jgi:hypothetical protein
MSVLLAREVKIRGDKHAAMKVRWLFEYIHLTFTSSAFGGNGIYLNYSTKMALPDEGQGHEVEPWAMEHG